MTSTTSTNHLMASGRLRTRNEKAFVRHLEAKDDEPDMQDEELAKAIDAFVLTGAVKLYREAVDPSLALTFRHHTMLVHDSV